MEGSESIIIDVCETHSPTQQSSLLASDTPASDGHGAPLPTQGLTSSQPGLAVMIGRASTSPNSAQATYRKVWKVLTSLFLIIKFYIVCMLGGGG